MAPEPLIHVRDADHGSHPEALSLNPSFRAKAPILKLGVDIAWTPLQPMVALSALEARLVKLCPSLRDHQCRGHAEYHILRSVDAKEGQIAPSSGEQLKSLEKQYRLYSLAYPVLWTISKLDLLLFPFTGYAVSVVCKRPA